VYSGNGDAVMETKLHIRSFSLEKTQTDTQNETVVTSHFQSNKKKGQARLQNAANGAIQPAIDRSSVNVQVRGLVDSVLCTHLYVHDPSSAMYTYTCVGGAGADG
jgi:hypothetical protein